MNGLTSRAIDTERPARPALSCVRKTIAKNAADKMIMLDNYSFR